MGAVVKFALVLYLVTHGVPVSGEVDLRGLATIFVHGLLAQLRLLR
jgi:hypothetical protein